VLFLSVPTLTSAAMANNHTGNMRVSVLGCPITKMGLDDFVRSADQFIMSGRPHYIAVVNVAKVIKMRSDEGLRNSVLSANLIGADGVPLVWASRLLGNPLPGRVNGTDLMYELLQRANHKGYRIFFLGATQTVLDNVLGTVRAEYPGVKIAGSHHGYFTRSEEFTVVEKIRASEADIIFIAFGTPKKELWVKQYLAMMGIPVVHGVGGSFDVLAGMIPRAPVWMQKYGLEWLFRLLQEPRRMWRRYLVTNTLFVVLLIKELFLYRLGRILKPITR
jgi:N-acetylglucosaminyldiphosphoundecaprenol N-acetyl-beta-D-mannosaminyltransferase